jgi:hypothetical protein
MHRQSLETSEQATERDMTTRLEARIGGHLQPEIVHLVFEEMQNAPVKAASRVIAHRMKMVLEVLDDDQKKPIVWSCLKAWFEVQKCLYTRTSSPSRLTRDQVSDNVTRIAQQLGRSTPAHIKSWEELLVGFAVCRIRPLGRPTRVLEGLRGADDTAVVLLPLQKWTASNGLFCTSSIEPGQDICLGGAEEVIFPGTGGCLVLSLILKLPRTQGLDS